MRVEAGARSPAVDGARPAQFADALSRAGGAGREARRVEETGAGPGRRDGPRRPAPPGDATAAVAAGGELRAPGAAARSLPDDVAPVPELAALARCLPPTIGALGGPGGPPLALSFGRSLSVELHATGAGVDVVLRPEPGLVRAAELELPRLVAALRVRGVAVSRAEVRRPRRPGGRAR